MSNFTFFYQNRSPFSNWYPSKFTYGDITFTRGEQYMRWAKAVIMNDTETAQKILDTDNPKLQKDLGRSVKNYNDELWSALRFSTMVTGLYEKFNQNPKLKQALLDTGDTIIAEASPTDLVWGIGWTANDPEAQDMSKWRGQNLLGKVLMKVRGMLYET